MKKYQLFLLLVFTTLIALPLFVKANNLSQKLAGRILLQVEANGEAYYVHPSKQEMYFLGRPDDAFSVMREQGIGISNENLAKIPVSLDYLSGEDSSGDGLPDAFKVALGLDINSTDSDGDGYDDFTELLHGYDPLGPGKLNHDLDFASSQAGRILLQVEKNGEAWYVSPENNKRYFLGRPNDAFNIMRNLGLGISNVNLEKIVTENNESVLVPLDFIDCGSIEYSDMVYLMSDEDGTFFANKMDNESKASLNCINQAMKNCEAAGFHIFNTDDYPFFIDNKNISSPDLFLIIKGEEENDMCKVNKCLIPKQAISNHYNTYGNSFIFTLVGFSPQEEGSKVENNDLYDPVTNEVFKEVCPVGQSIFTDDIEIPEELISKGEETSRNYRKVADISFIYSMLKKFYNDNPDIGYPNSLNELDISDIHITAPTPADCINNDYVYTVFPDETGLNTGYCLRYCLSQDVDNIPSGDPIYATNEGLNIGSTCPY